MNLDEKQKQTLAAWVNEGLKLSEIQKRLSAEFGLNLTYMQVRLLVDDLKLVPKDAAPANPPEPPQRASGPSADRDPTRPPGEETGGVRVTVDQVTRPGAVVSGTVTFRDGKSAGWYLDQMGRLGLMPQEQGHRPTAADVREFQMALETELARMGM